MYAPAAAIGAFGGGYVEGREKGQEDQIRRWDMMGMEALGRAFAGGGQPMAPPPGQPSAPPMQQGGPPMQQQGGPPPPPQARPPVPPQGGGAPPPGPPTSPPTPGGAPPQGGGLPQGMWDLPTLAQRIQARNPNLPPQAMFMALMRGSAMLNGQGKMQLAQMRQQMQRQELQRKQSKQSDRPRARNKKTGEEIEWDGKTWVPVASADTDTGKDNGAVSLGFTVGQ